MKKRIFISLAALVLLFTTASFKNDFFEIAKQIEIFTNLFKDLNMNYVDEINPAALMDSAIEGMLEDLDPYTIYWTEQEIQEAKVSQSGENSSIGATFLNTPKKLIIAEAFKDQPADVAGLKAGDQLIKIDNTTLADFDENASDLLLGAPGTTVSITYVRQGKTGTTSIKRAEDVKKAVLYSKLIEDNVGYIVLSQFTRTAYKETLEAVINLKKEGATSIILDLRNNPGGLLTEAVNISNIFLPKGKLITSTKSVIEKYNKQYFTQKEPLDTNIPVAVLINGYSASASEIVSGALQDYDRAVIVGAQSFGKGLVQLPKELTYGTQVKITISRYYTPSGRCIQALDYRNRDAEGNAIRVDANDYNEFLTANGRKVYDGGGIIPDIPISTAKMSPITEALLKDYAIFNYASSYYYDHNFNSLADFKYSANDYQGFIKYLKSSGFKYQNETEKKLEETYVTASKDEMQQEISAAYSNLSQLIDNLKEKQLKEKEEEISNLITDELITRYFYKEGLYTHQIKENKVIASALNVLGNKNQYSSILKGS